MWSHYGDRHKGICLGFDVPDNATRSVKYIDAPLLVRDTGGFSTSEVREIMDLLYYAKCNGWSYEEEIRAHARPDAEEGSNHFAEFGNDLQLKEVIAGPRFSGAKSVIEDTLVAYSELPRIIMTGLSQERFEIIPR
jgi:hypothetical protein